MILFPGSVRVFVARDPIDMRKSFEGLSNHVQFVLAQEPLSGHVWVIKHVRLRRDTVHLWLLDVADHRGKWERTHVRALLKEALGEVVGTFPWLLTSRE